MINKTKQYPLGEKIGLMFQCSRHQFKYGKTEILPMVGYTNWGQIELFKDNDLIFSTDLKPINPILRNLKTAKAYFSKQPPSQFIEGVDWVNFNKDTELYGTIAVLRDHFFDVDGMIESGQAREYSKELHNNCYE